ncbi:MAG: M20 family metallo-hydrolase [Candidatus Eisenbacteria bacterium]|nr:M20 family metallo-hydrolase [Candidatus Eisenbacteria bacterium]
MVALQVALCAIPALCPTSGGEGELKKEQFLKSRVAELRPDLLTEVNAPDPRVPSGIRPTLVAKWKGADSSRTLWIMTHTDVVPPGEASLWTGDPWTARVQDGKIYGRGVEDNQQSLVASFFALKACLAEKVRFPLDVGLMFMADEETGSALGMAHVMDHTDLVRPGDLLVVPDGGSEDGGEVEIAEKGGAWIRVRTRGRQCHASTPQLGVNAFRAASALVVSLDGLYQEFPQSNPTFDPPVSTFEPTKKEPNVPNVNTIPGDDVFHVDCRVLPEIPLAEVVAAVRRRADAVEQKYGVKIDVEPGKLSHAAPPTPPDAPVVRLTTEALRTVYGVEPRLLGIGGGTVAAFPRRKGLPAVVIGRNRSMAHQPDEFCVIDYMIGDAKVFARMMGAAG